MAAVVDKIRIHAFTVPTEEAESDGTLGWDSHTLVLVEASAGDMTGLGYSYTHPAAATLIADKLATSALGLDATQVNRAWRSMRHEARNLGTRAVTAAGISAVDNALWDLKARLFGVPLVDLLPGSHDEIPVYGSGGFTSYSDEQLAEQFTEWKRKGIRMMKMKVGREPKKDVARVRAAREAVGGDVALFVDANGALSRKKALWFAEAFAEYGVSWFEEPVSSDDLEGLRLLRDRAPAGMEITAGEYGWDIFYFRQMLDAGAVDVLQADATRCTGMSGFLVAGDLCAARSMDLSAHTAPNLHAHVCCAVPRMRHIEYFVDHARIELLAFEGSLEPENGALRPDRSRTGNGLTVRWPELEPFRVFGPEERRHT